MSLSHLPPGRPPCPALNANIINFMESQIRITNLFIFHLHLPPPAPALHWVFPKEQQPRLQLSNIYLHLTSFGASVPSRPVALINPSDLAVDVVPGSKNDLRGREEEREREQRFSLLDLSPNMKRVSERIRNDLHKRRRNAMLLLLLDWIANLINHWTINPSPCLLPVCPILPSACDVLGNKFGPYISTQMMIYVDCHLWTINNNIRIIRHRQRNKSCLCHPQSSVIWFDDLQNNNPFVLVPMVLQLLKRHPLYNNLNHSLN